MTAPHNKWFDQEDYAKFECGHFRSFERNLDWILHNSQKFNKNYLEMDDDRFSKCVELLKEYIENAREAMAKNPEMKSPKIEKFLEETLNEANAILHKRTRQNANTYSTTPWTNRYYKEESYAEKKARWDYEESQRYQRNREEWIKKGWIKY
jgi:hypothetical protein